jgi:aryl-alcohol dehydrogenase-like predicted oxidoreductase
VAKVEEIAKELGTSLSAVALGWLRGPNSIPIASARTVEQLKEILPIVTLSASQINELDLVSA